MALTNCKECKKEVSTQAKTCPYCGIDNPGIIENNNRRVGAVVLALLIFLFIYILTRPESAVIRENKGVGALKTGQETNSAQSSSPEQSFSTEKASTLPQQPSVHSTPQPPFNQVQYKEDNTNDSSATDTPQIMVMRMLEYALNDGGLSHESEIQQTKLQIESSPKPVGGNKKAARTLNAKGLALSKKGDFNDAVKMFAEASKSDRSDVEIVNNLGFSYLKQGNLDSAQQAITMALTLSPDRATAWENLGELFGVKGDISKAVACFSNVYRFSKDRLKIHQYMKKLNENEDVKKVKQARAKAINWAESSYLNILKNTESKGKARLDLKAAKK